MTATFDSYDFSGDGQTADEQENQDAQLMTTTTQQDDDQSTFNRKCIAVNRLDQAFAGDEILQENEDEENEEPPTVKEVIELNGVPIYLPNHLLMDECNHFKCVIYERIGFDDLVGGTYLATAHDKELVLRVEKSPGRIVSQEFEFLKKIETGNEWKYFSQLHSAWHSDGWAFYMVYYKSGPSFRQVRDFMKGRTFSHGSAGRLMRDIFKIIRIIHKHNMLLRCLDSDMFHFDSVGRNLFLSNLSTLRADPFKKEWDVIALWEGGILYGPLTNKMRARDDIVAWFYLFIELVKGELPWSGAPASEVQQIKASYQRDASLVKGLPFVYNDLFHLVMDLPNSVSEEIYDQIEGLCVQIYEKIGLVTSMDDNFDFERNPTDAELPRFFMEKSELSNVGSQM